MVVGYAAREAIRFGTRYFPRTFRTIKRADVGIHKSLYGASGGRGVRHGRDIGSLAAGAYHGFKGDDLDNGADEQPSTGYTSRKFRQTRDRYVRGGRCRCHEYNRFNKYRR